MASQHSPSIDINSCYLLTTREVNQTLHGDDSSETLLGLFRRAIYHKGTTDSENSVKFNHLLCYYYLELVKKCQRTFGKKSEFKACHLQFASLSVFFCHTAGFYLLLNIS